jgi:hypothetical protein
LGETGHLSPISVDEDSQGTFGDHTNWLLWLLLFEVTDVHDEILFLDLLESLQLAAEYSVC